MLFVATALFVYAIGSLFVDQVQNLVDQAPDYVTDIEHWVNDTFDTDINTDDLAEQLQSGSVNDFATGLAGNVLSVGAQAVGVLAASPCCCSPSTWWPTGHDCADPSAR